MRPLTLKPEREDAHYSLEGVRCPKARILGYSKVLAEQGDLITWHTPSRRGEFDGRPELGRVLGRVDARGDAKQMEQISGWIAVIALANNGTFAYERWVNPAWVVEIHAACPAFFALIASGDPERLLRMVRAGALSAGHLDYRAPQPLPHEVAEANVSGAGVIEGPSVLAAQAARLCERMAAVKQDLAGEPAILPPPPAPQICGVDEAPVGEYAAIGRSFCSNTRPCPKHRWSR